MDLTRIARHGQLRHSRPDPPHIGNGAQSQPLVTTVPALAKLSMQIIGDTAGLVLDPWNWRARLVGTTAKEIDEDRSSQPDLSHQKAPPSFESAGKGKGEPKSVHFVEPEKTHQGHLSAAQVRSPADQVALELYEAVVPAEDIPRVIDVDYNSKNNRWRINESTTFPDREDPVAMICSRSVLRAMTSGRDKSKTDDPLNYKPTSQPQFQVNRLAGYWMTKLSDGDPAKLNASSHDRFHIINLEEFLLHIHHDPQHAISASGGQYMKHWLVTLQQLITISSKPNTRQKCKAAFWELVRRGFAEKVTLQLWDDGDPQPGTSTDIEVLDWTTWVSAYKTTVPEALRQDVVRALDFFHARVVSESSWPAVLHPNLSIMSHRGITSATTAKATTIEGMEPLEAEPWSRSPYVDPIPAENLGKPGPKHASTSHALKPYCRQGGCAVERLWELPAKNPGPPPQTQQQPNAPSPLPYPRPFSPSLPKSILAAVFARRNWRIEAPLPPLSRPSTPPRADDSKQPFQLLPEIQNNDSQESSTSVPSELHRSSSSHMGCFLPDVAETSLEFGDAGLPCGEGTSLTHGDVLRKVYCGSENGKLVEPSEDVPNVTLQKDNDKEGAAARVLQALQRLKLDSSAYDRHQIQPVNPKLVESYERAMDIRRRSNDSWKIAASRHGVAHDNAAPQILEVDTAARSGRVQEYTYQVDEVLHAEQRMNRSVTATQRNLVEARENWLREQERILNERVAKAELKKQLRKEWECPKTWGKDQQKQTTPAHEGAEQHPDPDTALAPQKPHVAKEKLDVSSGEHRDKPFENVSLPVELAEKPRAPDDKHRNAIAVERETCLGQLEMAADATQHLRRMLNATNEREIQRAKQLEEGKKELARLRSLLSANSKECQISVCASGTVKGPQASFENGSQRGWCDAPPSVVSQSTEAKEGRIADAPIPLSLTPNNEKAAHRLRGPRHFNGNMPDFGEDGSSPVGHYVAQKERVSKAPSVNEKNGMLDAKDDRIMYRPKIELRTVMKLNSIFLGTSPREAERYSRVASGARLRRTSPTPRRQPSPPNNGPLEAICDSVETTPKASNDVIICAGPSDALKNTDTNGANDTAGEQSDNLTSSSGSALDQESPSTKHVHAEVDLMAESSNISIIGNKGLPPGTLAAAPEVMNSNVRPFPQSPSRNKDAARKKCSPVKRSGKSK